MTEYTHVEAIRVISGAFDADDMKEMASRLVLCNLIARDALGLADHTFTDETLLPMKIKLKRAH